MEVKDILGALREKNNLTQEAMAERVHLSQLKHWKEE